jgi:hypothetical protein
MIYIHAVKFLSSNKRGWQKLTCNVLATTLSLLLLCDGDGIILPVTKVANFDGSKLEIMITTICGDVTMIICNVGVYRAPKFLVDPLEGPSLQQCGRSWNLEHDPDF